MDWSRILQSLRDTPLFVLGGLAAASWTLLLTQSWLSPDLSPTISNWAGYVFVSAVVLTALFLARGVARLVDIIQQARVRARAARVLSFNVAPQFALVNGARQPNGTCSTQILIDIEILNHSADHVGLASARLWRPCVPLHRVTHVSVSVLRLLSGGSIQRYSIGPHTRALVRIHCIVQGICALPGSRVRFFICDTAGHRHRFPWMRLSGNPGQPIATWWARTLLWLRVAIGGH